MQTEGDPGGPRRTTYGAPLVARRGRLPPPAGSCGSPPPYLNLCRSTHPYDWAGFVASGDQR
jgi:hypothetical protein